jgi:hypothetical protein
MPLKTGISAKDTHILIDIATAGEEPQPDLSFDDFQAPSLPPEHTIGNISMNQPVV